MRRAGRPRRGSGKESPPLNLASGGGNSRGRRAPPSPTRLPPQEEKYQGRSGDTEPDREPTAAVFLLRGLQQSLGRQLPGGASPQAMKRGGPGRKGTKSDSQKQAKRDRLAHEFGEWQDWLRDTLRETGFFIARTDSKIWLTLIMAAIAGILHWYHITTLFENDRHFSHLSTLEREMAFRTEMGLYYSYFKTIVEAPSFYSGVWMIMNDNLTEYPLVINTLKRFNLYPEVVLASWYRIYTGAMNSFGIQTQKCWTVNRGEGLSPVESCEGLGDPASFYVAMIFLLNGLMVSVFFLYGTYLSGNRFGGLLTVACYFFNHGESTRVMWTPPLRESFSYPFLVVQMLLLTYILRMQNVNRRSLIALSVSNVLFMLPWQFAQFVLLTQVASVFGIYILGFIDSAKLQKILYAHMVSLAVCFVFMFGNSMLMTSYYAAFLIVSWSILELGPKYLKLYTKNIPSWTPVRYMKTLLLPVVLIVFSVIVVKAFQCVMLKKKSSERQEYYFNQGEIVYHALQLIFFTILAILIMRLKLFLTPHMCIMASLICSKQLFGWIFCKIQPGTLVLAILAMMAFEGIANLQKEWSIVGEFSNLPQEELLLWIKANTKPDAVFAGAMPTMASVKLSAQRPIVNHPHYEDAGLRARTKIIYSMYSRKSAKEVKRELLKMGVNYYILEDSWCLRRTKPGCSMPEIWDIEDLTNAGKIPLCNLMCKDSRPYFRTVFNNNIFKILEVTRE
ncbi:probable C-mannosyltransferase DPY19L1 isoform X2 [Pantherophis guttatus]|uniref:Probable C-mannosyltransferase DPY19L1 isoform X2 n=1 Tax=Pantherophis guttatus TaxID=94885 RepID=A0A6P9BB89_PANGU|nr:probable C-mannosyltransferase DPY19L1 isoform X2 [Pantherophis guttatus]